MEALALLILVGLLWGLTNPLIKRGTLQAASKREKKLTGLAFLDSLLHHLSTPGFIIPQALNLAGSVLFAASLGTADLSVAVPLANGTSLLANALLDTALGEGAPLWPGLPGVALIVAGVTLCTVS